MINRLLNSKTHEFISHKYSKENLLYKMVPTLETLKLILKI